jgi:hypothetical protein
MASIVKQALSMLRDVRLFLATGEMFAQIFVTPGVSANAAFAESVVETRTTT